jgi:hypothetical protein
MMDLIYRRKSCREFLKVYSEELYKDLIPDVFEIGVLNLVNSFNKTLFTKSELKTIIEDLKNKDYFQINDIKTIQKLNTNLNNNKTEIKNSNNNNNNNVYPNWWWDNKEEEDFDTEIENFKSKHNFNPKFKINPNSQRFNQQNYQQENYQQKKYNYPQQNYQQNYSQQNYSQNQSQFTSNIPTESNNFNNNNENLNRNFPQKMTMKKLTMGKFYNNQMTQTTPQESQIHSLNSSKNSNLNYLMSFDKNLNIEKVEEKKYENKRKF